MGKIARQNDDHLLRNITFEDGTFNLREYFGKRTVGKPRLQWTTYVHNLAFNVTNGNTKELKHVLANGNAWKSAVKKLTVG